MSLRARLLVGLAAIVLTFAVAAYFVTSSQRHYLVEQVDRQLETVSPAAFRIADGHPEPGRGPGDSPTDSPYSELWVGFLTTDGTVIGLVNGDLLEGSPDVTLADAEKYGQSFDAHAFTVDGTDTSSRFRVRLLQQRDRSGWLVAALPLKRADQAINRLWLGFGVAALVVGAMSALAGWWVVRLGLRPIKKMTEAADAVAAGASSHRVEFDDPRTEAGRLGRAFNVMLDERQAAEDKLRRFVADASHELRTPVTSIRGYVDLYRQGGLDEAGRLDDAMRRMGQEAGRMGGLVEDLLLLANLDEGRPLAREPVDLGQVLHDAAGDALAMQPARPVTVDAPGPGELVVTGDEARLRQVIGALVHNALVHTPETASLSLRGSRAGDVAVVEVSDTGQGMDAAAAAKAFERFYRGDPSRSRHQGGSGLGLSIAKSIVDAHGGRISLDTAPGTGTRFAIALPL